MNTSISWNRAYMAASASKWAYEDLKTAKPVFKEFGFTTHKYIDIDGAQAHVCNNKETVLIACRGTEPTQVNDLLADLNAIPKRHGPGFVHSGFRGEARKIWEDVYAIAQKHKGKQFIVTGHSLGAAMATYIAQELAWHGIENIELYTFGSPRLGSDDYVEAMSIPHWRFVNNNDGVTHVPPMLMGFKHHGKLMYINHYGNIRDLSRWQRFKDKLRGHWAAFKKFQFFDAMYDHSMDHYEAKVKKATEDK
jgi:triacylglycerol lipase